jgi:putative oxidoreductase
MHFSQPVLRSALRIVAALSFMTHGTQKLFAWPPTGRPPVDWFSQIGLAGGLELVGGVLLLVGLFTRPVAFVVAGEMAWAYFQAHASRSFWPIVNGGELTTLYCFLWLYFCAAGPGPISLDALFFRHGLKPRS